MRAINLAQGEFIGMFCEHPRAAAIAFQRKIIDPIVCKNKDFHTTFAGQSMTIEAFHFHSFTFIDMLVSRPRGELGIVF